MSLLSRMFGRKGPEKSIGEMSLADVVGFIRGHNESLAANDAIATVRRLTDIAMFDHGVSEEEREFALGLIPALDEDIEAALKGQPGAFEAYQEAAVYHRSGARHCGYGSLQWKMDELGVEAAHVIHFIARADHAELLPAFLEMMEPEVIRDIRGPLLTELATARAQDTERPLDVLSRLAAGDDGALTQLLDGPRLGALRRAETNPAAAEEALAELGVRL